MKAVLLLRQRLTDADGDLLDLVVWEVPADERHPQGVRYRMAFVPRGHVRPAVLYDNHHPKGHHKHVEGTESVYPFAGARRMIEDFRNDVGQWKKNRGE